ncbi:hypothetical protein OAE48_00520 [Flavobacteriales bacterium]|nr:hypothetical protein [Flavobacteriales bacterium]
MRAFTLIIISAVLLSSCDQREKELEQKLLEMEQTAFEKDKDINAFIDSFTAIQTNLDSIKELEGIVTARAIDNPEKNSKIEGAIVEDMMLIYENMKRTRNQIETLEEELNSSSIASEKLKSLISKLKKDITERDNEITMLKEGLVEANIYIDKLMSSVDRLALENERRVQVIQQKNVELQKKEEEIQSGFWIAGTTKDLRNQNVIDKEGAFLGLGGVKVVSEDMNLEDLAQINIQEVTEIELSGKKPELVTSHPKHTYEFVMGEKNNVEKLVIDDPDAFWQNSKVLVIVVN